MRSIEEVINRAKKDAYNSYTIYSNPLNFSIIFSDPYVFLYEKTNLYWKNDARMIITFNRLTLEWSLYVKDVVKFSIFRQLCKAIGVDRPPVRLHKFMLIDIIPNAMEFPLQKYKLPSKNSFYFNRDYDKQREIITNITPDHLDGISIIDAPEIKIVNGKIKRFGGNYDIFNHSISRAFDNKLILPNKEEVELKYASNLWERCFLVKTKNICGATVKYPVDINGKPITDPEELNLYWDNRGRYTKIYREICKNNIDIPSTFNLERFEYHFYGKKIQMTQIKKYLKDELNGGCQCERCRGYRIFVDVKGKKPWFNGWSKDHYKMIHASIHGEIPDTLTMIVDCNCKACQAFRNTTRRKKYIQEDFYKEKLQELGCDKNKIAYLTADWRADICVRPENMDKNTDVNDFHWRYTSKQFKRFKADMKQLPIEFYSIDYKYRLAYNHCRFNNIPWKDIQQKSDEWLMKVFNTMLNPDCNCMICEAIKNVEKEEMEFFDELLLEKVDQRAYPTTLVTIHFTGDDRDWYWRGQKVTKKDMLDFFEKYVLVGKYCECEQCQKFLKKMENSKYLPREELKAPKCPLCGNAVHKRELIYENADIAEKIIKQGYDNMIGVRTALCCSCHGKWMASVKRKKLLFDLKPGEYVKISEEQARVRTRKYVEIPDKLPKFVEKDDYDKGLTWEQIKELHPEIKERLYIVIKHGTGELQTEEWITLNEFAGKDYDFKLPKRLEDQIHIR